MLMSIFNCCSWVNVILVKSWGDCQRSEPIHFRFILYARRWTWESKRQVAHSTPWWPIRDLALSEISRALSIRAWRATGSPADHRSFPPLATVSVNVPGRRSRGRSVLGRCPWQRIGSLSEVFWWPPALGQRVHSADQITSLSPAFLGEDSFPLQMYYSAISS